MMPVLGVVAIGGRRWLLPLPLPVVLAWPLVLVPLGAAAGIEWLVRLVRPVRPGTEDRRRPTLGGAALAALWQLSGLRIDVRTARGVRVLLWLI